MSNSLELELGMVVSHHVVCCRETNSSLQEQKVFSTTEPSDQPHLVFKVTHCNLTVMDIQSIFLRPE